MWGGIILHNTVGICVMTIVALFAHYVDYRKIPVVGFLTLYSTEIYLYQFMMLNICGMGRKIDLLYVLMVVVCTLLMALPTHQINKLVSKSLELVLKKRDLRKV